MTRAELEHAIRAACDVSGDHELLAVVKAWVGGVLKDIG
jgi:hypothetical protein